MDPSSLAAAHIGGAHVPSPASWDHSTSDLPPRPARVAQLPRREDAVLDEKHAHPHRLSYNSASGVPAPHLVPGTSVSSAGGTSVLTGRTADTIDLEKAVLDSRTSSRAVKPRRDMAERWPNHYHSPSRHGSGNSLPYDRNSTRSEADDEQEILEQRHLESKALNILLFLSGPCAALSFVLCFYSLLATLAVAVVAPVRIFTTPRFSLWEQILSALTSAQRLQLRCIYASAASVEGKSVAALLLNLLLSPVLSMGVAVAAWTVAIYWIFAAVVGDPDGSEGGDDGRATVVGLRKWWESWLSRAIRD